MRKKKVTQKSLRKQGYTKLGAKYTAQKINGKRPKKKGCKR